MELTRANHDLMYNVYLDGNLIGWWEAVDTVRGWVDVLVGIDTRSIMLGYGTSYVVKRHRLFGIITLKEK